MNAQTQGTHWRRLINTKYLGAYSLPANKDLTVTIRSVNNELVEGDKGRKDQCIVAQIVGNKPLILNKTNCKTIEKMYGPVIENWAGKQITLYESTTRMGGEMVGCLRIRSNVPNVEKVLHPITPQQFDKALKAVETGHYSIDQIVAGYALTQDQLSQLNGVKKNETN